ncbi:MAG: threonine/serine dehydratase [Anaerolineae bacterium]|nr:threonine/serine dehydratase [Anaerolineae bacterium]
MSEATLVKPTLTDVYDARSRISGYVRHTPIIAAKPTKTAASRDGSIYLKLECLQVSGSFKARGAVNKLMSLPANDVKRGVIAASGGNHGLGVAYAGWIKKVPVTIYLSGNTPPAKAHKLESWGAQVKIVGEVFDDAQQAALEHAAREGLSYLHPFADRAVIAGQGTVALEMLDDLPDVDVVFVAIGGGGLISGVSMTLKTLHPRTRIVGIEPTGAPTLYESLRAGRVIELPAIHTSVSTLAPRMSAQINFEIIQQYVDDIVLVSDEEMHDAARWLWREMGVAAELSGSAAMAAILTGRAKIKPNEKACVLVCGVGTDGIEE